MSCVGCDLSMPAKLCSSGLRHGASVGFDGHNWWGPDRVLSNAISESCL